jgi:hypothetical protein
MSVHRPQASVHHETPSSLMQELAAISIFKIYYRAEPQ